MGLILLKGFSQKNAPSCLRGMKNTNYVLADVVKRWASKSTSTEVNYISKENPKIVVCQLEYLKDVDIIVNSTDKSLKLHQGGGISETILEIGGDEIQGEIDEQYPSGIEHSNIAVTKGYNLPYKKVYHCTLQSIDTRISHHLIREVIERCLARAANQFEDPSIAFPAIGTGAMGFPPRILKTMYRTILEFMLKRPQSLREVYIIIHPSKENLVDYMKSIDRDEERDKLTYAVKFPSSWSETGGISRNKIPETSAEYRSVAKKFNETIGIQVSIEKIERIEHKRLFVAYKRFKNRLANGQKTEKYLWHGTKEENVGKIIRYGFDRRLSERAQFGKGCYFAVNARYSDQDGYAAPNNQGEKFMFLVKVVEGRSVVGTSSIDESNLPTGVQSTKNKENDIFVTYDDDQQYPAYLVVYKHS